MTWPESASASPARSRLTGAVARFKYKTSSGSTDSSGENPPKIVSSFVLSQSPISALVRLSSKVFPRSCHHCWTA